MTIRFKYFRTYSSSINKKSVVFDSLFAFYMSVIMGQNEFRMLFIFANKYLVDYLLVV